MKHELMNTYFLFQAFHIAFIFQQKHFLCCDGILMNTGTDTEIWQGFENISRIPVRCRTIFTYRSPVRHFRCSAAYRIRRIIVNFICHMTIYSLDYQKLCGMYLSG
jgi:hypothetical protein